MRQLQRLLPVLVVLLGLDCAIAHGADTTAPARIAFSVYGVRVVQDYTPSDNSAMSGMSNSDPWGIWHSGIVINLGIKLSPGWTLLRSDQLHANARTDAGEILSSDPVPGRQTSSLESFNNSDWRLFSPNALLPPPTMSMPLVAPVKPAARITALQGSLSVVVGDSEHLGHLHIVPTVEPRQLSEIPGCDLAIAMNASHQLVFTFTTGALKSIHDLQFLRADGSLAQVGSTGGQRSAEHSTETLSFNGLPAESVQVNYYTHLKAFAVDFTLVDLPLVGKADPALLERPANTMTEVPLPSLTPEPSPLRPALREVPAAAPATPSQPRPSF